ncbi:STAS domain-containing protein [Paenibacillus barcinonensis]|uniref:Anti-anti-sigma factor n=1 Tax=Paenibacillus barcinonensis TaxID=198119 RepID=A0A2V4V8C4_PAEBA|nr:STAS domain-containing protein [Paenibacillus barcinonensis]PYE48825.1 anti-anti-sigma factor [Paenibacillus barcinonensis]QKS57749.1 STAS domain-containing protein [Paenibacillus barcinonensis]
MFNYALIQHEAQITVALQGDIDLDVTEVLQEEIAPQLVPPMQVEFDFTDVAFVDSSGIGLLITLIQGLKERGQKVLIRHVKPEVQYIFTLLQLPLILGEDVFDDQPQDSEERDSEEQTPFPDDNDHTADLTEIASEGDDTCDV